MRTYNLKEKSEKILNNIIVNLVSTIHEYKGKQTLYIEANHDILTNLLNIAKLQSTEYSNRVEYITNKKTLNVKSH